MSDLRRELHKLEREFGLNAVEILDVINNRNRCKIAVRGAIAEAHLLRHLRELESAAEIERFEDYDIDRFPDCRVYYRGHSFLLECKNVEKPKPRKRALESDPVTIDFQRTRNPIDKPWERFYLPDEFQIVAACLWNRTGIWDFRFAATADLPRHSKYADGLSPRVVVDVSESSLVWSPSLQAALRRLVQA